MIKQTTRFRVLHLGGNCANNEEYSNEIELSIPPRCPTYLQNTLEVISSKNRYCTNGTLDLKVNDECLPPNPHYRWRGPNAPSNNRSSVTFTVPDIISPPSPCSSYTYWVEVSFASIPGCTISSSQRSVTVCKILPFTLNTVPPYSSEICQASSTAIQILPDSP
ncbi:MAG: hypothetical protein RML72_05785 [Bacteroidia bacterium]|nr:hypothetical protein [Bacteroidia bacterium]